MVYGGALAAGAFSSGVVLFGTSSRAASARGSRSCSRGRSATRSARSLGWAIGIYGGRPFLERRGRWLHLSPPKLAKAERWFDRWGDWAVFLGRITPVARSFVSIPAGVFRAPLGRYTVLTFIGSTIWCVVFAAIGYAFGTRWETLPRELPLRGLRGRGRDRASAWRICWCAVGAPVPFPAVQIPLVDVKAQYAPLIEELRTRFDEVLASGAFIRGPNVAAFEQEAAAYLGVKRTIGVANGTDALVLVLDALEVGPGDEVICPAFTFYATAESIARRGATPVFADIDPATLNLDADDVAARVTDRTKAIMPVHLFGRPMPLGELAQLGLPVIEDAAQAFGSPGIGDEHRVDVQLLPDQEPLLPRRRRAHRGQRRRARRAGAHARLPRLARQDRLPARRLQLAPRRAPGRVPAPVPRAARGVDARAPRGRRALRGARARRARASFPPTSRGTSTTSSSAARPSATRSARRSARRRSRRRRTTRRRCTCNRRCASSAGSEGRCPRPSARPRRTSPCRSGPGIAPAIQERVVDVVRSRRVGVRVHDADHAASALAGSPSTRC